MSAQELLEDSLKEPAIAQTSRFKWHITPVGIAALAIEKDVEYTSVLYEQAINEGQQVGLDLTREEKESYSLKSGLVILFYS